MTIMKYLKAIVLYAFFFLQVLVLMGARSTPQKEVERPEEALKPVFASYPIFRDDMDFEFLALAIRRNISYLIRLDPQKIFNYGPHQFRCREVYQSQQAFLDLLSKRLTADQLNAEIRRQFRIYRASGCAGNNKVLFTGYYEPVFDASLTPDDTFKYSLYRKPGDLLRLDLSFFDKKSRGESIVVRIQNNRVLPYYTRYQIEMEKVLEGKDLEIAWLKNPIDVHRGRSAPNPQIVWRDGAESLLEPLAVAGDQRRDLLELLVGTRLQHLLDLTQGVREDLLDGLVFG